MSDTHSVPSHDTEPENHRDPAARVDDFLEQYASATRAERAPSGTRARLREALSVKGARSSRAYSAGGADRPATAAKALVTPRRPHRFPRYAIAAASIAVFILAGATAITLGASGPQSTAPSAPPLEQRADDPAGEAGDFPTGNFFVLKAWADETAAENAPAPSGDPVGINWLHPAFVTSWETWQDDPVFGELLAPGEALTYFNFDAQCEGANLASVSYRIDNENAFFEYFDWREVDKLREAGDDPQQVVEHGPSFTLTYGSDGTAATAFTRLYVISPCPDEYARNPHAVEGYAEAARVLDGSTITLSATFDDGTTQEQAYRIAMAENFDEKCREFLDEYFAAWDIVGRQGKEAILDETSDAPKLFTLESIDA